jgi:hypothetical protein
MQPPSLNVHEIRTKDNATRGASMRGRNRKLLTALGAVGGSLLAVSGGLAWADGASTGGRFRVYEADTALAGNFGTVILTGAVTDHGIDHQGVAGGGTINRLVLAKGSFEINVGALGSLLNFPVNPNTCSSHGSATAPVPIVGGSGTGAYQGISGTFEGTVAVASIVPRLANGSCDTNATQYPGVLIASGGGTVSFK